MTFEVEIKRFTNLTDRAFKTVLQKVSLELTSKIIKRTPVDTGRARGNWQVGFNSPPQALNTPADKSGDDTIGKAAAKIGQANDNTTIYTVNNLPYIEALESGTSQQAPSGMVSVTVKEFVAITEKEASKV